MGTPAWQKRESERQQLLERLRLEVYQQLDDMTMPMNLYYFLQILCGFLAGRTVSQVEFAEDLDKPKNLVVMLNDIVLPQVRDFSRSSAEENALLQELSENLLKSAGTSFSSALRREEMMNPQLIFQASSSTAEEN